MTEIGALIDQLGDLVFESIAILIAVVLREIWTGWLVIYLFREFTVTVVRTWVISNGGKLPSSWIGKAKSACIQWAFFLIFLGIILKRPGYVPSEWNVAGLTPGWLLIHAGMLSMITGIGVGLISAWQYLVVFAEFYVERLKSR
jgi:phosphatidylglycerophosphate synthase